MELTHGTRLGPYEILARLGEGGMGEVYRARDRNLNRDVAIKVILPAVANDPDRLARFRREAQVLASLNHPNIAHIHGLEQADGVTAIIMELVEGPTLAERIAAGPLPLDEAVAVAAQIAEGLQAAHEQGIVHRDLKPANVKVRPDGTVKVLDFGLARALDPPAGTDAAAALADSPTLTSPAMTARGVILGTSAYMSPEQAKGLAADKRSDVWAFGCVLYEMLAAKRAFVGEDVSDTLAGVIKGEPDWNALPSNVPPAVTSLIQACVRKSRKERIGDLAAALFVLTHPRSLAQPQPGGQRVRSSRWRTAMLVLGSALLGAAIAGAAVWRLRPIPPAPVTRFSLALPPGQQLNPIRRAVAMSPDGARIVYAANSRLYLRSLSDLEPKELPTAGPAVNPVFSPDGRSLVFWADEMLKRIDIDSPGSAVRICEVGTAPLSISWSESGILFSPLGNGIMRVSPNGGKPEMLVDMSTSAELADHPQFLPDGRTLLFTIVKRSAAGVDQWDNAQIVVQSLDTGARKTLFEGGSNAQYVPTGHIVYVSGGMLMAAPFDLRALTVTGGAVPVIEDVQGVLGGLLGTAQFAFSNRGSAAYVPGAWSGHRQLVVFDRSGTVQGLKLPPGRYRFPRVSRDGSKIAFETSDGKEAVISIYELSEESSPRRLTFGGNNRFPVWSADGGRLAFQSDREGDLALFWQPVAGGAAERLTTPAGRGVSHVPESWSPDGQVLLFSEKKDFLSSLWILSLRDRKVAPFSDVRGSMLPTNATFRPDGRWVAYQIGETSRGEGTTFVQPFPPTGARYQIAHGGRPVWSRDGKELFFVHLPPQPAAVRTEASVTFSAVRVSTEPSFTFSSPAPVPRRFGIADPSSPRPFDVLPDGRIVGVVTPGFGQSASGPAQIQVILNWFEELKARAGGK